MQKNTYKINMETPFEFDKQVDVEAANEVEAIAVARRVLMARDGIHVVEPQEALGRLYPLIALNGDYRAEKEWVASEPTMRDKLAEALAL